MYIAMEYIEGRNLEDLVLGLQEPFHEKKVIYIGTQLCEILFYLHTLTPEPVIFRDLKPGNLLITEDNTVKIIDFGVARNYDPGKDCDTVRLGTPGYAAPEQCRVKGQSTPRSDIYALGVVLHQLLTLNDPTVTPFKLPPIRKLNQNVSEQLEWIISKATNLDPRDRYLDAGLFREEMTEYYKENYGSFMSPYKKHMPFKDKKTSLAISKQESFFSKSVKKYSNLYLPVAIGAVILLGIVFFFYPQFYTCLFPFIICIVGLYFLLRECGD